MIGKHKGQRVMGIQYKGWKGNHHVIIDNIRSLSELGLDSPIVIQTPFAQAQSLSVHEGAYHASWYLIYLIVDHRTLTLWIQTMILTQSLDDD